MRNTNQVRAKPSRRAVRAAWPGRVSTEVENTCAVAVDSKILVVHPSNEQLIGEMSDVPEDHNTKVPLIWLTEAGPWCRPHRGRSPPGHIVCMSPSTRPGLRATALPFRFQPIDVWFFLHCRLQISKENWHAKKTISI